MPRKHSSKPVEYRSLAFLGCSDNRVGDDGSVWSKKRKRMPHAQITYEIAEEIRRLFRNKEATRHEIMERFGVTIHIFNSVLYKKTNWRPEEWRLLKPDRAKSGHLRVYLSQDDGKSKRWPVSNLVLLAFVGPRPDGMQACHFPDRDPTNNNVGNLRWGTPQDNSHDRWCHDTMLLGEDHPRAKITTDVVLKIREMYADGVTISQLMKLFGLLEAHVAKICKRRIWKHI